MFLPSRRLLALVAGMLVLTGAAAVFPQLPWVAPTTALALLAVLDLAAGFRVAAPHVARRVSTALALGVPAEIELSLSNRSRWPVRGELHDHHPSKLESAGLPRPFTLAPGQWTQLRYRARPVARGEARFGATELRLFSPLGLWQVTRWVGADSSIRIYPNFRALARYTLLATDHRLSQIGVLQRRRRGEGTEFHQLREYRQGDAQRAIDWKATARTGRLISREYEDEKDQRVLLVIDCGRRMAAKDDELSHFDHTLNAALLLAHVAARQGDAVGMLTIAGASRYSPPRKSLPGVHAILNCAYDLEPTLAVPDYHQAALEVMRRLRRRALVILLTNLRDEDDRTLLPALALLRRRHLVVLASLREAILARALTARVDSFDRAVTHAAAAEYLGERERAFRRFEAAGTVTLDVEPTELPIALVNRYLELKRGGLL